DSPIPILPVRGTPEELQRIAPVGFLANKSMNPPMCYHISPAVVESRLAPERPTFVHVMRKPDDPMFGKPQLIPWAEEETFRALAFHEVRHRVQYQLKITLINKTHTDQIPRCRVWGAVQEEYFKPLHDKDIEFDAHFFQSY